MRPQPLARRPSVTIVVPCYNYGRFLPFAIASVLSQAEVDVEAIVIDDASTDGSQAVVERLAESDRRVRAILHDRNRGHIATYNEGLAQARGDYVVLLSADDALAPGALQRATALLEANPTVGLAYGFPLVFEQQPTPSRQRIRDWTVWPGLEWIARCCRSGRNFIHNPEVVLRMSVQRAIGGYDPALPHSGDLEMWLRAASVSDVGRVNGVDQAYYRIHDASLQRTRYKGHLTDLEGRLAAFEKVLTGASAPADAEVLFATARRALAFAALGYARGAFDNGLDGVEPVSEYLAFAERVWPLARATRAYKNCERRSMADSGLRVRESVRQVRRGVDDLTYRLRWRRWRRSGLW
jgi:glycosyltransferase involved in cell wall biosynthesis